MLLIKSFFQTDEYLVTFEQNHIFKKIDAANQDRWIFLMSRVFSVALGQQRGLFWLSVSSCAPADRNRSTKYEAWESQN